MDIYANTFLDAQMHEKHNYEQIIVSEQHRQRYYRREMLQLFMKSFPCTIIRKSNRYLKSEKMAHTLRMIISLNR